MSVTVDLKRDDLFLVNFQVNSLDATRLIPEDELGEALKDLPEWLKAYFRKSFIDQESLNPFGMLRKRVRDYLADIALNSSIGWIINPIDAEPTAAFLEEIAGEYEVVKRGFIDAYETKCSKVIQQLREEIRRDGTWKHLEEKVIAAIEKHRPTVEELEWRLRFRRFIYPVPTGGEWDPNEDKRVAQGILSLREGLFGELVAEVALNASKLLTGSKQRFVGLQASERRIRFQTRRAAERPLEKLQRLAFLDKRAVKLKEILDTALASLPSGDLTGPAVDDFIAILTAMGNQFHLIACLEKGFPLLHVEEQQPDPQPQVQVVAGVPQKAEATEVAVPPTADEVPPATRELDF